MKKYYKRLVATLLLTMTLFGSVLTVNAACGHAHTVTETVPRTVTSTHTHTDASGSYQCMVVITYTTITVRCENCGAVLSQRTDTNESHNRIG